MLIVGDVSTLAAKYLAGVHRGVFSLLSERALVQFLCEAHAFKLDHMHELCHNLNKCIEKRTPASALRERWVNPVPSVTMAEEMPLGIRREGGMCYIPLAAGYGTGLRTRMGLGRTGCDARNPALYRPATATARTNAGRTSDKFPVSPVLVRGFGNTNVAP